MSGRYTLRLLGEANLAALCWVMAATGGDWPWWVAAVSWLNAAMLTIAWSPR